MKILVTGATGFIGAAIARKLSQQRHEILALSRSDSAAAKLRSAGLIPVFGDFADPVSLAAPAAQVDAIVSTASIGQVEGTPDSFAKDRDTVAVITKALGDSGKPLIFTSGSAIFGVFTKGEASPTIFDEDHPVPLPASVFASPEVEIPAPFIDAFGGAMVRRVETETAVLKAAGMPLNAPRTERLIQTCNQHLVVERFGKKADRASRKRLCTRSYFRKSGQENDRQMMTLRNQFTLQLHPIHARHLHVTDQAIGVTQAVRFQERVSGRKLDNCISQRSNEAHCRVAKRVVIIDDCDHGHPRQLSLQFNNLASIVKEPNR
jgi:hypothetical protein